MRELYNGAIGSSRHVWRRFDLFDDRAFGPQTLVGCDVAKLCRSILVEHSPGRASTLPRFSQAPRARPTTVSRFALSQNLVAFAGLCGYRLAEKSSNRRPNARVHS
jgi:hypothetical protein